MAFAVDDPEPVPDYKNFLVYCDESSHVGGKKYYGFGSLWMPYERRGDFANLVSTLRNKHRYLHEIKWNKIDAKNEAFFRELTEEFFRRNWLMFHCLVGRKGYLDKSKHPGGFEQALEKHFALLLKKKIEFFSEKNRKKAYHVVLDQLSHRYAKADEAMHAIINNQLRRAIGFKALDKLVMRDSRETDGIQVADTLLGAVVTAWNEEDSGPAKKAVRDCVAEHLGWRHLRADTKPWEWKFNVWYFHDPRDGRPREAHTWYVNLKHEMPRLTRKSPRGS